MAQHNEATEIVVHLKPDFLGRLSIRVLADDHVMRVEIRADNEAVRQVMQDSLADLQQRLSEKGFAFDQFNVLSDAGSNPQREPQWELGGLPVPLSNAASRPFEESPVEAVAPTANGVIDIFA
jgi:flagellar hook-length control protein FliK